LEEKGVEAKFPRDAIKQAFKYEIIEDGETVSLTSGGQS
jgi:hypothetical protein